MIHRITFFLALTVTCYATDSSREKKPTSQASVAEEQTVILDADFATLPDFSDKSKIEYKFVVTITNVSKADITIPSRSFDGEPCCWRDGADERGVSYYVGEHRVGEHLIVPSPLRFFPVILRPGESTEFAQYNVKVDTKTPLRWFSADLTVDEDYGKKQGWWTGYVSVRIDLKTKKPIDPFF